MNSNQQVNSKMLDALALFFSLRASLPLGCPMSAFNAMALPILEATCTGVSQAFRERPRREADKARQAPMCSHSVASLRTLFHSISISCMRKRRVPRPQSTGPLLRSRGVQHCARKPLGSCREPTACHGADARGPVDGIDAVRVMTVSKGGPSRRSRRGLNQKRTSAGSGRPRVFGVEASTAHALLLQHSSISITSCMVCGRSCGSLSSSLLRTPQACFRFHASVSPAAEAADPGVQISSSLADFVASSNLRQAWQRQSEQSASALTELCDGVMGTFTKREPGACTKGRSVSRLKRTRRLSSSMLLYMSARHSVMPSGWQS